MLAERGIVSARTPARCATGWMPSISSTRAGRRSTGVRGPLFYIDRLLIERCGETIAGRLHAARSRNEST